MLLNSEMVRVVRVLLEGGANVDRDNTLRSTALHNAALKGRLGVRFLLLEWGAKVDSTNAKRARLRCMKRAFVGDEAACGERSRC